MYTQKAQVKWPIVTSIVKRTVSGSKDNRDYIQKIQQCYTITGCVTLNFPVEFLVAADVYYLHLFMGEIM